MRNIRAYGMTCLLMTACGGSMQKEDEINVEECAGDADTEDVTFIIWEFKDSIHEMITCGSLTFQLITGLVNTAASFASGETSLPSAFSYDNGNYTVTGTGVVMDLSFVYGSETPGGEVGVAVEENLFDLASYLRNPTAASEGNGLRITFDEPGPLVALLGVGSSPESPLVMSESDVLQFVSNLVTLRLGSRIFVDHEKTLSVITYEIDNNPKLLSELLWNQSMDMMKATATASRDDLQQNLSPTVWDIQYGEMQGTLDGEIEVDVLGGPFDFHARLAYNPFSVEPTITIDCIDR